MMRWLRKWWVSKLTQLLAVHPHERICGTCECRGVLYITTDTRILRYDPDRDQFTVEGYTR